MSFRLAAGELGVGVAAEDITPPMGIPMAGYYHERGADGVLDPLFCRALVIAHGEERIALATLDLIGVTRQVTDRARALIEKETALPKTRVLISATHAHTGPVLSHPGRRAEALGGNHDLAVTYSDELPSRIARTVRRALDQVQPADLSVALGKCEDLAFNRRYFMRNGTVGWNPGKLNPDMVMPAGPTDTEVGVLYAQRPAARLPTESVAAYVSFAMHPDTCGGSKVSADWPGALERVLRRYHGPDHITLLGNGASGNLNNFDFSWSWPNSGTFEQERIATLLGAAVFQAYKQLRPVKPGPLLAGSTRVELALREVTPEAVAQARQTLETIPDDRGGNFMRLVRAYRDIDIAERNGDPFRVEVQVLTLGSDLAWVSLPGEAFVELGLAIKQRSPFPATFVVALANENIGYIPDRRSYAEGNYEPESARCAPGSGEALVEAAVGLLTQLHSTASL